MVGKMNVLWLAGYWVFFGATFIRALGDLHRVFVVSYTLSFHGFLVQCLKYGDCNLNPHYTRS